MFFFRKQTSKAFTSNGERICQTQMLLIGATRPSELKQTIAGVLDLDDVTDVSPHQLLHHIMPHVSQKFMRVRASDKPAKALYHVSQRHAKGQPIMVFTSNARTCHWLHKFFEQNNVDNIALHANMPQQVSAELSTLF